MRGCAAVRPEHRTCGAAAHRSARARAARRATCQGMAELRHDLAHGPIRSAYLDAGRLLVEASRSVFGKESLVR